ncbi:MAG: hypothetical protein V9H25_06925 [Candidatus Competibacter sp.]
MSETSKQTSSFDAAIKACRRYLMEKGNRFDRGPSYEGDGSVLGSVKQTVRMYEGMGYTKLMELGDPPIYAVLARGHREVHVFQPQDPKVREWLEHDETTLNDPALRAYMLEKSGLQRGRFTGCRQAPPFSHQRSGRRVHRHHRRPGLSASSEAPNGSKSFR